MSAVGLVRSAPTSIQLHSGRMFDILNPDPERISIEDIATSLAKQCRYNGHCRAFYSVAQHSDLVSRLVPERLALAGLLHDAAEAYIGDIVRPLKILLDDKSSGLIHDIEARVDHAIAVRFGVPVLFKSCRAAIKHADNVALATEKRDLMAPSECEWADLPDPSDLMVLPWGWEEARDRFLHRFQELAPWA